MKTLAIVLSICLQYNLAFAQGSVINFTGRWEFAKCEFKELPIRFDVNDRDSCLMQFMKFNASRSETWTSKDSISSLHQYSEMSSFFETTYFIFKEDSTFVTNFFSDQESSQTGRYSYFPATKTLCLKKDGHVLNQDLTNAELLPGNILQLLASGPHTDLKHLYLKKK